MVVLPIVPDKTAITSLTTDLGYTYGISGMYTDSDVLYLYLPDKTKITAASTESAEYMGLVTSTSSPKSGVLYEVPKVTSVSVRKERYKAGDILYFIVNFSTHVTVNPLMVSQPSR